MKLSTIFYVFVVLGAFACLIGVILSFLSEQIGIVYIGIGGTITMLSGWARGHLKSKGEIK